MKTKQNKTNPRRILGYLMAFAMVFFSFGTSNAQCSGYTSPYGYYGSYDMGTLTNGVETQISSCSYAGEIFSLTNLTAGDEILITTCGNASWDSFLEVRDLSGNCIAANDDGYGCDYNFAAQVTFTVPASGDYDLVI
ncbi:MAG: hypothetical protein O2781_04010, partial [Bacteroidetes bacterium]|nr:hypothetical protein [Bacteroidota bacterium]